ncbi:Adenylate cyclase type 9 [Liparis tanakae]|uniref:Adenylate cyclase type 9 n=1 Tax=Liparis tanakae TaxID=230148 RepID=A0A4Z2HBH2_9TELE|nr:Adenylate cyclase type 9 [Liparis tanakae]
MFLCCATILAIIQYCNFCQLSFWMRSVLATVTGVALLLLLYSPLHRHRAFCQMTLRPRLVRSGRVAGTADRNEPP